MAFLTGKLGAIDSRSGNLISGGSIVVTVDPATQRAFEDLSRGIVEAWRARARVGRLWLQPAMAAIDPLLLTVPNPEQEQSKFEEPTSREAIVVRWRERARVGHLWLQPALAAVDPTVYLTAEHMELYGLRPEAQQTIAARARALRNVHTFSSTFGQLDGFDLTQAEAVTVDRFEHPWRRRVLGKKPLTPAIYGASLLEYSVFPEDPVAQFRPFFAQWENPTLLSRPRGAIPHPAYPFEAQQLDEDMRPEFTYLTWWTPLSRVPPGRPYRGQRDQTHALTLDENQQAETIESAKWFTPLSLPARPLRGRILAGDVDAGVLQLATWGEEILLDKWHSPLSRPPGRKPWPRLPWTIAIGESFDERNFVIPIWIRLRRPMYGGGYS